MRVSAPPPAQPKTAPRAALWALIGSVVAFAGFLVERHSNASVEEKVRAEAAQRCPGVWLDGGTVVWAE